MMEIDLQGMVKELNRLSAGYRVGKLQQLRMEIRGHTRNRRGMRLVVPRSDDQHYAFHWGGRTELQFNFGIEDNFPDSRIRYGVAFSNAPSRTYPNHELRDLLAPKIERFNEYLRRNPDEYASMKMWHWNDEQRSDEHRPGPIQADLQKEGVFIFLGRISTPDGCNPREVLETFDELLPLYEYVESDGSSSLMPLQREETKFFFKPGCSPKPSRATGERDPAISDIRLRHNAMQSALYGKLVSKHGVDKVGTEIPSGNGVRIDLVVRDKGDSYIFYEIKTAREPRICIREAIGQLLEYAYWSDGGQEPTILVIVGPSPIDAYGEKYLAKLNAKFGLPIKYDQLQLPD